MEKSPLLLEPVPSGIPPTLVSSEMVCLPGTEGFFWKSFVYDLTYHPWWKWTLDGSWYFVHEACLCGGLISLPHKKPATDALRMSRNGLNSLQQWVSKTMPKYRHPWHWRGLNLGPSPLKAQALSLKLKRPFSAGGRDLCCPCYYSTFENTCLFRGWIGDIRAGYHRPYSKFCLQSVEVLSEWGLQERSPSCMGDIA